MKHNTHIYLAAKAIELTRQSVDNMHDGNHDYMTGSKKTKERISATTHQRIFQYYQDLIEEATWAPDDVLKNNDPNHIFKLFTDEEFPGHGLKDRPTFKSGNQTFYKFAGGLPYRVDHLARSVLSMCKLREFNDQFDMKQIMYQYLLLSHYIVDAHVPMHCDLRDDPPKEGRHPDPSRRKGTQKPSGKYMKSDAHSKLESLWDEAVTPLAIEEEIFPRTWAEESTEKTELSDAVAFTFNDCKRGGEVEVITIPPNGLMNFMIDVCINSKKRSQRLFPLDNPEERDDSVLKDITREIFADCIGSLLSIWRQIWSQHTH
jgi:hypothetical protein